MIVTVSCKLYEKKSKDDKKNEPKEISVLFFSPVHYTERERKRERVYLRRNFNLFLKKVSV